MSGSDKVTGNMDPVPQSARRRRNDCEARLHHVLAYISGKRRRRWAAAAAVFLLVYHIFSIPFDSLHLVAFNALEAAGIGSTDLFGPTTYGIVLLATTFLPPLAISLIVFSRLRRTYRGY